MAKKEATEMTVEKKLENLYKLQTMLSKIDSIKTLRGELPLEVRDLEDEIEGLTTRLGKCSEEIATLKAGVNARRSKIDEAEAAIARYKEQLDDVRNNREYDMLSKEIEYQTLEVMLQKKEIDKALYVIDMKENDVKTCNERITSRREDLEVKKAELDEIIDETKAEEEQIREKAKALEVTIEPRLLAAFKRIRNNSRNGLGIVYVERDACGGCFNKIPPQRQLDVRMRKKVIVCEYCGRILIDPELAGIKIEKPEEPKTKRRVRKTAAAKAGETKATK
jgi:uncharacterized protein